MKAKPRLRLVCLAGGYNKLLLLYSLHLTDAAANFNSPAAISPLHSTLRQIEFD